MSESMTPGERRELRSIVRQRIKILRADVEQRKVELYAEAEARLVERYSTNDKTINDLNWRVMQITDQANKDMKALIETFMKDNPDLPLGRIGAFSAPYIRVITEDRTQLHRALTSGIDAQVKTAMLDLDRREADLLSTLAIGTLETDAAREFLGRIPTVAELVPSTRLREIESAFDTHDHNN